MSGNALKYLGCIAILAATIVFFLLNNTKNQPEGEAVPEASINELEVRDNGGDRGIQVLEIGEREKVLAEAQSVRLRGLEVEDIRSVALGDGHSHRLGVWHGRLTPHPSTWDLQEGSESFALHLPDGNEYEIRIGRKGGDGVSRELYAGEVVGADESTVIISRFNSAVSGVVRLPFEGVSWELRNRGNGLIEWEKVNLLALSECTKCGVGEK